MSIYDYLICGNQKYGSNKEHICESNFWCKSYEIKENVIIAPTWESSIFKNHVDSVRQIAGPTGHGYNVCELSIGDKEITHITTGLGASNLIDAVLSLGCTPCRKILFMGSVGALDESMNIGDIVIPEYSVSGVGVNRYLTVETVDKNDCYGRKYYPDKEFSNKLWESTNKFINCTDIKIYNGHTFSVDTIFSQYAHIEEFIKIGCNTIEMETAALFHAANIANMKSAAILNISDNTVLNKSLYSGRTNEDLQRRCRVKKDIMPKIALDVLLK